MREIWAKRIALLTGLAIVALTILFAITQNPGDASALDGQLASDTDVTGVALDAQSIAAGEKVYTRENCARCHSVAGQGNPRNPLDGVGSRHSSNAMADWIIGAESLRGVLPDRTLARKQRFQKLSAEDLRVLSIYMQSLRSDIGTQE